MRRPHILIGVLVMLVALCLVVGPVGAQEDEGKKDKPERGMVAALLYPGITVGPDDDIRVDFMVKNIGRSNETVLIEVVEKPEGWKAMVKDYGKVISGVFVAEDDNRNLTFNAEPEGDEEKLPPGEYDFKVTARTLDGALSQTSSLKVKVVSEKVTKDAVKLATSYPKLSGPSDSKFEFSLDVNNESDEDTLFNLQGFVPEEWEVSFKPAYEQKQISSLQIKANQSRSVGVLVTPPRGAEIGEYPIKVKVGSSKGKAEVELTVVLTGTYEIKTGTMDSLLSVATRKGHPANMSMYVKNEGSAAQREISFLSFKPENWDVEFKPEKIENIKPGEIKQVEVSIKPAEDALVGDYQVIVNFQGEKVSDDVELRVTVKAASTWGWIGVAIIVLVILGLAITFKVLGRR